MEEFPKDSPFHHFRIASQDPLRNLAGRQNCSQCKKSIRYFCYCCIRLAPELKEADVPKVSLPLHLAIVKDTRELEGKSTVIHAKLLAEKDTSFFHFDRHAAADGGLNAADFDPATSVVLFPSADSKPVEELDWTTVKQIVVLDGTWKQAKAMCSCSPLLSSLPKVHLSASNRTVFWRYQNLGPHCLSTIEAIYYFYKEYSRWNEHEIDGLDNLLFFYSFFYHLVQESYLKDPERQIHTKLGPNYIKHNEE